MKERQNPMIWHNEPEAQVLAPFEGSDVIGESLSLLGLPDSSALRGGRDLPSDAIKGAAVEEMLGRIADALSKAVQGKGWRRSLDAMSHEDFQTLADALGQGEVSMIIAGGLPGEGEAQIAETVLPGVWLGQACDEKGVVSARWVEVADAPFALRRVAVTRPKANLSVEGIEPPEGAMNVMAVLAEVAERADQWRAGDENHVFNFTLFPMTPADSAFLARTLGEVGVSIVSGGYGTAQVRMTAIRNVWSVQYVNGLGHVILDTLEVGDVPASVLASVEDFTDSAERLAEIQGVY